jgi:serine/threonine-protein kinase RsbW
MRKDIEISSDIENLRIIEKVIDDLSQELGLSDEVYGNVLVATMEAANNAIVHGNKKDITKVVRIHINNEESGLIIKIFNQGSGFDHTKIPDPTSPENIEKINGRGLFLMERLSDEITFLDEGRAVELKFKI